MTNIKCKGGREIDLLAVNPITNLKYYIESRVSTSFILKDKATYTKNGVCNKNGLDYFEKEKFENPFVKENIQEIFGNQPYFKTLVVWKYDFPYVLNYAHEKYDISVLSIKEMIFKLMDERITSGSRDDVLRLMELVFLFKKDAKELLREWDKVKEMRKPSVKKDLNAKRKFS